MTKEFSIAMAETLAMTKLEPSKEKVSGTCRQ